MKKLNVLLLAGLLAASTTALAGEPSAADQKWLEVVQKMAANGPQQVSTPSEERMKLLKDWADKNGYQVKVTKLDTGYRIELAQVDSTKVLAQK